MLKKKIVNIKCDEWSGEQSGVVQHSSEVSGRRDESEAQTLQWKHLRVAVGIKTPVYFQSNSVMEAQLPSKPCCVGVPT